MAARNDYSETDMFQQTFGQRPMTHKGKRRDKNVKQRAKLDAKLAKQQARLSAKEARRRSTLERKYGKHSAELSNAHSFKTSSFVYSGGGKHQA